MQGQNRQMGGRQAMPGAGPSQPVGVQPGASDPQLGGVNLNQGLGAPIPVSYPHYALPGGQVGGHQYQYSPNHQMFGA